MSITRKSNSYLSGQSKIWHRKEEHVRIQKRRDAENFDFSHQGILQRDKWTCMSVYVMLIVCPLQPCDHVLGND